MELNKNTILDKILEAINQLNQKSPYYTLGILLLGLFLVDYFVLMQFQLRVLYVLNPKVAIISKDIRTAKEDMEKMSQYAQEVQQLTAQVRELNSKIHSREEIPLIIDNVNRLANANGIRIEQVLPSSSVAAPIVKGSEGQYFAIPLLIEARGGYHNFGKFINQIERQEKFMTVGDFSIEANPADPTRETIKVNLNTIVFQAKGN